MSDVWCPLPWIHQFVTTTGVKMCCNSEYEADCTPTEFERSPVLREVKEFLSNDIPHPHCDSCYKLEAGGLTSTRQNALRDYPSLNKDNIKDQIQYYDLRYSNLCNYSCRTCNPDFSSSIGKEVADNDLLKPYFKIKPGTARKNAYEDVADDVIYNAPGLTRLLFTGGEPLLIKENLKILDHLIEIGNTDCEILITTNGSVINPAWLTVISKFNNVHWTVSLDGVGSVAEYIRNGCHWSVVKENFETILKLGHSVSINTTLSAYSVLTISQIVEFFLHYKKTTQHPLELWFGTCQWPEHLNPAILQGDLALKARQELEKSIKLLATEPSNPEHCISDLKNALTILNTSNNTKLFDKFSQYTKDLDLIRNQSFSNTFNLEIPNV